ncbi:FAD-dependent oxidoreductase [Pontibacillus yanchengensis]|uniref:FAD-dependent oxidoreductase n=1 Tax=Pontibacillus yanchengensis TaxID=462910 RepID=A0ACC7VJX4_9BACI|nr:NAD(P)/FAD-dependent oxidoreductase [Pontibacillus yanchengensis]MYL54484.1 FAD-dependent oxidoreductase [Pontibacillus yanchengensis]
MTTYDMVVVGAGFGGLSAAALLAKKGYSVAVLEASSELGGCAGKFNRPGYRFQAGATVGMGFEEGGVLKRLFDELKIALPPMKRMDTIMNIHMRDETIHYYREKEAWFHELDRLFPHLADQAKLFFEEVFQVGSRIDHLLDDLPVFPPKRAIEWMKMTKYMNTNSIKLIPYMTQTLMDRLKSFNLHKDERFLAFLNGQLMDSVQTTAEHCPAFLGHAALQTFHKGAYAVKGGLTSIAESLATSIKDNGGEVHMRRPALHIEQQQGQWVVHSKREKTYITKKVILNNSMHNFHYLFDESISSKSNVKKDRIDTSWGAFMLYLGVEDNYPPDVLYHQIIQNPNKPLAEGNQFLLSLSAQDDRTMAPEGKRAITISTHTEISQWWQQETYEERKSQYVEQILDGIEIHFPSIRNDIDLLMPGTPVTFERYVRRDKGRVGGYIPNGKWSWLNHYSVYTGLEDVFSCGDTTFPGAGTLGTTLSGWIVANEAMK